MTHSLCLDVAVAAPIWPALTYQVPAELAPLVRPFTRLMVPLRGRPKLGFALETPRPGGDEKLKPVLDVIDDLDHPPVWPPSMLGFFRRAAAYYQAPLGQMLGWCLPAGLGRQPLSPGGGARGDKVALVSPRKGEPAGRPREGAQAAQLLARLEEQGPQTLPALRRQWPRATILVRALEAAGWVTVSHCPLVRDLLGEPLWPEPEPDRLNADQRAAVEAVGAAVDEKRFEPFLLQGVPGSGKTEVYLAACRRALAAGRSALILTPEIGLCLRLEGLTRDRFGQDQVAVLHSGVGPAQRRAQWRAIAQGSARVVVGARSAVFAPLSDPGVICVDEEQDEAYKQDERLRYHGRDLALLRGQEQSCPVLLGSATPAVTTWHRSRQGSLTLLRLPKRIKQARLPAMEVVDLRSAGRLQEGFLSPRLYQALKETVAAGQQAILFLNRRGFAPALICPVCGATVGCPACSLSLTWHQAAGRLICHTCGHQRPLPSACPSCGQKDTPLKPLGLGTEQVAARLMELEPDWKVARLDRDTAVDPASLRELLGQVLSGQVQVVVGTQMLTKGHHFPGITLVGVLLADQALAIPDYRAAERAFILITQVAGRAGREGGPSRVIVQTYDPHHPALAAALAHRPRDFYQAELAERRQLGYPPFARLVSLRLEGGSEGAVAAAARELAAGLDGARRRLEPRCQVLGPAPAPVPRVSSRFRYLILLKAPSASAAAKVLGLALHQGPRPPAGVRLALDVDPLNLA